MQRKNQPSSRQQLARSRRRLGQAALIGLSVAGVVSLILWSGLFSAMQVRASDYLYETQGDPGDEIVIVAIDEKSQQVLGDWPWPFEAHTRLFEQLAVADVVGFDVLLPTAGDADAPETVALLAATRRAGNVVLPLVSLELTAPTAAGELYIARQTVRPFPELLAAAAGAGAVKVPLDSDGTLRRVPLLVDVGGGETWEAFSLRILRRRLGLGDAPAALIENRVVIGDQSEVKYQVRADAHGAMLINFVGRPNTFPTYSFIDVAQGQVPEAALTDKIVLVGMMNTVNEMDLHRTPVSAGRMAGVEFQANALHTLLNHRPLVEQSKAGVTVAVALLALVSALVLSQLNALPGALFSALLAGGYFVFSSFQFDAGRLPNVLLPYASLFVTYAAVTAARFASERGERRQVTDVFGRFVSPEVRDAIVDLALQDPDLIQPGGRQMEISILFADIRGFTNLSEKLPPSQVIEMLNQYLDSMEEQVFKHGGTLDKYTGDGMMVLFGAPLEQPDHARQAVRAALAMQQAAAEVSRQRGDVEFQVAYGIGITTGSAVVGHIGSRRRLDYTAIGDTVNLAARLEGIAPPGVILIDQATAEAVRDVAQAEALEPVTVKGKARPVVVYRLLGLH